MDEPIVSDADVRRWAEDTVNLKRDDVADHRDQVNRLRDKLAKHVEDNPGFALVKMLHSGSVAKGTALSTLNDMDVAVYVEAETAPTSDQELVDWMATRLREAYPQMSDDQIQPQTRSVQLSFSGSGLDVDVVPVLYEDDEDDRGYLVERDFGDRLLTSIPLHLEFIRTRKDANPTHFAQVIRLLKWWARQRKLDDSSFKAKSFMLELIVAHLADRGKPLSPYPDALEEVFGYIVRSDLAELLVFDDYYDPNNVDTSTSAPIQVFDPVNPDNNVATRYTIVDRDRLVEAADDALSAVAEARYATTKGRAVACWQRVFGTSFKV